MTSLMMLSIWSSRNSRLQAEEAGSKASQICMTPWLACLQHMLFLLLLLRIWSGYLCIIRASCFLHSNTHTLNFDHVHLKKAVPLDGQHLSQRELGLVSLGIFREFSASKIRSSDVREFLCIERDHCYTQLLKNCQRVTLESRRPCPAC